MVFEESICERSWRPRRNMLFQRKFAFISAKCLSCTNISVPKTQQGLSLKFSRPHNLCKIPVQIHTVAVRVTLSCFVFVFSVSFSALVSLMPFTFPGVCWREKIYFGFSLPLRSSFTVPLSWSRVSYAALCPGQALHLDFCSPCSRRMSTPAPQIYHACKLSQDTSMRSCAGPPNRVNIPLELSLIVFPTIFYLEDSLKGILCSTVIYYEKEGWLE